MRNKMKSWRRRAAALKARVIARKAHKPGQRYGKILRDTERDFVKISPGASPLLAWMIGRL